MDTITGRLNGYMVLTLDAYGVAVKNGFKGTVEEWLESLKGEDGYTPVKGLDYWTDKEVSDTIKYMLEKTQHDWNAPEGLPGHVKNRTHWTDVSEESEVLPKTNPAYDDGAFFVTEPVALTVGEIYAVDWNGVQYNCVAQESTDEEGITYAYLGDFGAIDGTPSVGEPPFLIAVFPDDFAGGNGFYAIILPTDGSTELTISISGGEVVHKLDNKYLDLDWLPVLDEEEIIHEYTGEVTSLGEAYIMDIPNTKGAVNAVADGTTVIVEVNGVRYKSTRGYNMDGSFFTEYGYVSDMYNYTSPPLIGGKFYIYSLAPTRDAQFITLNPGTYTVRVLAVDSNKNKIPKHFLPDHIGAVQTVNGVAPDENGNVQIDIPDSGGDVDLTGYATEQYVQEYAQPKGSYLTEVPDGYAKTSDIPTDEHISSLIDTKLAQFANAEGVSF